MYIVANQNVNSKNHSLYISNPTSKRQRHVYIKSNCLPQRLNNVYIKQKTAYIEPKTKACIYQAKKKPIRP